MDPLTPKRDDLSRSELLGIAYVLDRHFVLDTACPVPDTGESSLVFWMPAGVYPPQAGRYDDSHGKPRGMKPTEI